MGAEVQKVLNAVPVYEGREEVIVTRQSTNTIITEVLDAHTVFSPDYDLLVKNYSFKKSVPIEDQLFNFLK